MVSPRRPVLTGVLAGLLICPALAGCGGSSGSGARQSGTPAASTSAGPSSTAAGPSATAGSATTGPSSTAAGSTAARPSASASGTISIPPYLCTGTDVAQNAADAFMGALSAGDLKQASACVLPRTVPAAVTRSLLASGGRAAAYLPRDGVDGPAVFGYRGNGKLIDVTVTKESDGRFWVTGVAVRNG